MSRADELREAVREATERAMDEGYEPDIYVLRTIVDHAGLSWEMVRAVQDVLDVALEVYGEADDAKHARAATDAMATILEAAGVEEGT